MTLVERLAGSGATLDDLTRGSCPTMDGWISKDSTSELSSVSPPDALTFFAEEILVQMLHRIDDRYPHTEGYSPLLIAFVAVYRAMRAAHDAAEEECAP